MRPQTRKLIQLVADELNDAIFGALQADPQTAKALASTLGVSKETTYRRLEELVGEELLEYEVSPPSGSGAGRRARKYRISDPALTSFRNAANSFGLAHVERLKRGIEKE